MSANTQVIVIKDDSSSVAPRSSSKSSIRRRKPWTPEDVEMTQLSRQALLDQIRNRRKQDYVCRCREESPKQVAFGRKVLNKQLSRSVNDVREVVGQLGQMVQEYRKLSSSQVLAIPAKCSCCSCKELRVEFRPARAHTLKDLSKTTELTSEITIAEDQAKDESKTCKVVELFEKPQSEPLKTTEISRKMEDFVEEVKALKRQLSKSVNGISISEDRFGLKVVGPEKIALSQIWTVPTNCGCCEPGKEADCKRLNVHELREKFIKEMVSPAEFNIQEIPTVEDISDPADPAKTIEPEKFKIHLQAELETSKVSEVPKADEEVQESTEPKIPAEPVKPTKLEISKAAEIPKEVIKESTEPLIAAIPAKTDEPEQLKALEAVTKTAEPETPKVLEVPKVEEKVLESTDPKIPVDPMKPTESEISKAAVDPKEVILAKIAEPEESKDPEIPTKSTELEASKVAEVLNAEEKVQETINLKISENPTELEKSKTAEVPKVIPAIPAKIIETEKPTAPEIPKTQEVVKDSTIPVIPANPPKTAEPEKPKVAVVPKPTEAVPQTAKPVIPAKPVEPPKATPTDASEDVDEDANIIVRLLTWMGFWSTVKPTELEATTTTAAAIPATTTTTTVAKPAATAAKPTTATTTAAATTKTAPITTTTASTVTVPTATTAKKESPQKPTNPTKPDDASSSAEEPNWVELQVPVVPREGTAKDANEESSAKSTARVWSRLYLNVLVEAGSGLIRITPVASCELLIKTRVVVWEGVKEKDEENHEEAKNGSKKLESSVKEQKVDM